MWLVIYLVGCSLCPHCDLARARAFNKTLRLTPAMSLCRPNVADVRPTKRQCRVAVPSLMPPFICYPQVSRWWSFLLVAVWPELLPCELVGRPRRRLVAVWRSYRQGYLPPFTHHWPNGGPMYLMLAHRLCILRISRPRVSTMSSIYYVSVWHIIGLGSFSCWWVLCWEN